MSLLQVGPPLIHEVEDLHGDSCQRGIALKLTARCHLPGSPFLRAVYGLSTNPTLAHQKLRPAYFNSASLWAECKRSLDLWAVAVRISYILHNASANPAERRITARRMSGCERKPELKAIGLGKLRARLRSSTNLVGIACPSRIWAAALTVSFPGIRCCAKLLHLEEVR